MIKVLGSKKVSKKRLKSDFIHVMIYEFVNIISNKCIERVSELEISRQVVISVDTNEMCATENTVYMYY